MRLGRSASSRLQVGDTAGGNLRYGRRSPSLSSGSTRDSGLRLLLLLLFALLPATINARVVINEVLYNAPDDLEDLEYIELHNAADQPVDLSGWTFTKGIKFAFAPGTVIGGKGFLVLCRNRERFQQFYDVPVAGLFNQKLSNKGERLELSDASGKAVDAVKYEDSRPWPLGADGLSGSIERVCPDADGQDVFNWASSPLSADRVKPAGTPGKANANYSTHLPPAISKVKFAPENPAPDQSVSVEADVKSSDGLSDVNLLYRLAGPGFEKPEVSLPMKKISEPLLGDDPGQPKDQLIRFRIQASSATGARRSSSGTDPRPALSGYVHARSNQGNSTRLDHRRPKRSSKPPNNAPGPGRGWFNPGMFGGGPARRTRRTGAARWAWRTRRSRRAWRTWRSGRLQSGGDDGPASRAIAR